MPIYIYQNPETKEVVEVFQKMNEQHVFYRDGVEWKRLWTAPYAAIDTASKMNPFSSKEFVEKTSKKSDNIGSLMDRAAEMSKIRAEKAGKDPIKEQFLANYKKSTGKNFFDTNSPKVVEKNGFKVSISKD